jgi:protein O-GlcNAc transferase
LITDNLRVIAAHTPTRRECGLSETAFVFSCFNNCYKITPEVFQVWMRLLKAAGNSVLWLAGTNAAAEANLRREVEKCDVSAQRLIFAPRVPDITDHLARLKQADLFLDTLPYNAHATACDALWAGLPLLTCMGSTFAGRVAASLLKAVGMDELITKSLSEYEALALRCVDDPPYLLSIKEKLARNRDVLPLFNTERVTRQIESAFVTMWERSQKRLRSIELKPQ